MRSLTLLLVSFLAGVPVQAAEQGREPIRFAMTAALSGPAKDLGRNMKLGVELAFARLNASGGIQGRRLELVAMDDGYDPAVTLKHAEALVAQRDILGFVGNVGTPTAKAILGKLAEAEILLFAPFSGAELLREPARPHVVNYRASYADEMREMVRGLLSVGVRPYEIAFFTQDDSYGDAGYRAALAALAEEGYRDGARLAHGRYQRNTVDVAEGVLEILWADVPPRAVILVGSYIPCAKAVRTLRRVMPKTFFLSLSFVGSNAFRDALAAAAEGIIVTQVVPPHDGDETIVADYLADLREHAVDVEAGFVSLEGYVVGRLLGRALSAEGVELTRQGVLHAVEGLGEIDVGTGELIRFGPAHHGGSDRVWPTILRDGRFVHLHWEDLLNGVGNVVSGTEDGTPPSARRPAIAGAEEAR